MAERVDETISPVWVLVIRAEPGGKDVFGRLPSLPVEDVAQAHAERFWIPRSAVAAGRRNNFERF